ncbi:hypothetical protein [Pseudoleptotrichia goodfellowii]|uniref:Tail sheath protein subtilisin-like domain-containing protein n=1 Tax=Pseudoleptotrichia goodfellowii TaxID=157692 RepID=A0A510JB92_9FUSO|nr:hypothetical protein [Pseudoleptotrichia goodfellowii]BBM35455.1 hypothetical protein JCM16774_0368 [Pseudoleptotrichia goodfellowii]
MSRNAIVSIAAINAALSTTTRDFSSVLLITKSKDVKTSDELPKAITSVAELKALGFGDDDKETILVKDYFGASTKPDYIWVFGDSTASLTYTKILEGLDTRWKGKWFYTIVPVGQEADVKEAIDFGKGTSVDYVFLFQGAANFTKETNLKIAKENKVENGFYIATDKTEGQITNLVATVRNFFPGSVPFASIKLNGLTGSGYSLSEILELVGSKRESETGVNIVTEEDQFIIPYYGKAMNGITWFDYTVAKIAIDEYMRVGITKYIIERNTEGNKLPAMEKGKKLISSKGTSILREFATRGIIYDIDDLLETGENAYSVDVINLSNREAEVEYKCYFQGAIIKSKVQITLKSNKGN